MGVIPLPNCLFTQRIPESARFTPCRALIPLHTCCLFPRWGRQPPHCSQPPTLLSSTPFSAMRLQARHDTRRTHSSQCPGIKLRPLTQPHPHLRLHSPPSRFQAHWSALTSSPRMILPPPPSCPLPHGPDHPQWAFCYKCHLFLTYFSYLVGVCLSPSCPPPHQTMNYLYGDGNSVGWWSTKWSPSGTLPDQLPAALLHHLRNYLSFPHSQNRWFTWNWPTSHSRDGHVTQPLVKHSIPSYCLQRLG